MLWFDSLKSETIVSEIHQTELDTPRFLKVTGRRPGKKCYDHGYIRSDAQLKRVCVAVTYVDRSEKNKTIELAQNC